MTRCIGMKCASRIWNASLFVKRIDTIAKYLVRCLRGLEQTDGREPNRPGIWNGTTSESDATSRWTLASSGAGRIVDAEGLGRTIIADAWLPRSLGLLHARLMACMI